MCQPAVQLSSSLAVQQLSHSSSQHLSSKLSVKISLIFSEGSLDP
jgi:hypothetical protein